MEPSACVLVYPKRLSAGHLGHLYSYPPLLFPCLFCLFVDISILPILQASLLLWFHFSVAARTAPAESICTA